MGEEEALRYMRVREILRAIVAIADAELQAASEALLGRAAMLYVPSDSTDNARASVMGVAILEEIQADAAIDASTAPDAQAMLRALVVQLAEGFGKSAEWLDIDDIQWFAHDWLGGGRDTEALVTQALMDGEWLEDEGWYEDEGGLGYEDEEEYPTRAWLFD
jgi:hypothetical protein